MEPDEAKDLYLLSEFPPLGGAGGCPARYGCQVMWPMYRWSYFVEFVKMYKLTVGILCQKLCKWIDFCID